MSQNHKMGDYLFKNGNIYKVVPHWDSEFSSGGLVSIFLQESTGKMFCSPYLIEKNDSSYINPVKDSLHEKCLLPISRSKRSN